MKKEKIVVLLGIILVFCFFKTNILSSTFTATTKDGRYNSSNIYSGIESHQEYIGIYSAGHINYLDDPNSIISKLVQNQDVTIEQSELLQLKKDGKIIINTNSSYEKLESIYQQCLTYKEKMLEAVKNGENVKPMRILEKGMIIVKVGDIVSCKIPHYLIVDVEYDYVKNKLVCRPYEFTGGQGDVTAYIDTYTEQIKNNTSDKVDFWGDASSWFGQAQNSGYQMPEQVNNIIGIFSDMINVVGTTVIVIATIVLGIKYIIGSVESKASAKEGLITLFIACVFFFGWTSIKTLLFPGNNFIFTSEGDTTYKNMVGRIFSTFTYIAQFVVVASIIYVGIKYIFAGADGRSELKAKSVYFIIGIILVFATTNVLSFVSNIITETIDVENSTSSENTISTPDGNSTYHESTSGNTHGGGGREL